MDDEQRLLARLNFYRAMMFGSAAITAMNIFIGVATWNKCESGALPCKDGFMAAWGEQLRESYKPRPWF
jgi:hypothetical protein